MRKDPLPSYDISIKIQKAPIQHVGDPSDQKKGVKKVNHRTKSAFLLPVKWNRVNSLFFLFACLLFVSTLVKGPPIPQCSNPSKEGR